MPSGGLRNRQGWEQGRAEGKWGGKGKWKMEEMCLNVGEMWKGHQRNFVATQICPSYRIPAPESPKREFGAQFK